MLRRVAVATPCAARPRRWASWSKMVCMCGPRSTKTRTKPPGRASATACCKVVALTAAFPCRRERQGPHGQDLDLAADTEGALGNLKQCRQAVKRRLYVGRCAAGDQELGPGQMWVLQPGQQAIRHRRCVNICPAEGRVRVSLPVRQLCPAADAHRRLPVPNRSRSSWLSSAMICQAAA